MSTFAEDLENEAGEEAIEAAVIGPFGWSDMDDDDPYGEDRIERGAPVKRGELLDWSAARPMLDYDYSSGYGAPECDAIWAWTATRILFVSQYDGSTSIHSMPRHPVAGEPSMPGG